MRQYVRDSRGRFARTPAEGGGGDVKARLEYLRGELRAERISYGELAELQGLAEHIDPGDVELLEWAGVPEFPETVDPNAWEVAELAHISTGQTIAPDEQTGDEWSIEYRNETLPAARVVVTFAVTKRATDEEGNWIDVCEIPDEEAHPFWRYAVAESTEGLVTETPADFWSGPVESVFQEAGEGSYLDYETEGEADDQCKRMAEHMASLSGVITWDGTPQH